jgi:HEPN domain-containing protein
MKQTAVEFLVELLNNLNDNFNLAFKDEIEQAKEMEKQQVIDAYIRGNYKSNRDMYWKIESAEKHYNETFNK